MKDDECVNFLQWALPRLQMRWAGFRKIRSRVCKRIQRHISNLQLSGVAEYQTYLQTHAEEWRKLDEICQVTISRFYRDKMVFAYLAETVLPALCQQVLQQERRELRVWSAGCASGEEPYSLGSVMDILSTATVSATGVTGAGDRYENRLTQSRQACLLSFQ